MMDKSEKANSADEDVHKKPYRLLKFAVDQVVNLGIPSHLQALNIQCANIEKYRDNHDWISLHNEQINASNTVRLLKSDIHDLQLLNDQIEDKDHDHFLKTIQSPTRQVVDALAGFLEKNSDVMLPLPQFDDENPSLVGNIPQLVCDPQKQFTESGGPMGKESGALMQLQVQGKPCEALSHWKKLKKDITELNELFKKFANSVFSQKASVDTIENHVQEATDNAISGAKHLKRALALQAAILPFAGAAIGGLLGPVGAVVGFNVAGSVACALGGSAIGYGLGSKIKQARITSSDKEMKALTASSKQMSHSSPDLHLNLSNDTPNLESKKDL